MPAAVDARPQHLRAWAYVQGEITSAPTDLPAKMDRVYNTLRSAGWQVAVESIGTDFSGFLGIQLPKTQPLALYLHRTDRPYTLEEAKAALTNAIGQQGLAGTFIAYAGAAVTEAGRVASEVYAQTAIDVAKTTASAGTGLLNAFGIGPTIPGQPRPFPWALALGGGVLVVALLAYVSPFLPRPQQR